MIRNTSRNSRPGPRKRNVKGSLGQDGYVRLVIPTGASSRAGSVMFKGVTARLAFESRGKPRAGNEGIMRDKQADTRRGLHIFIRTSFQLDFQPGWREAVFPRGRSCGLKVIHVVAIHNDVCHVQTGKQTEYHGQDARCCRQRPRRRKNALGFAFAAIPKGDILAQVNEPAR